MAWAGNHVGAYDFVFDVCANGQQLKCLVVIAEFTRECVAIDVAGAMRSRCGIKVLSQPIGVHGAPRQPRPDTGRELVVHPAEPRSVRIA